MSSPRNITADADSGSITSLVTAIISLGSNLPFQGLSPEEVLSSAIERLRTLSVEADVSSLYESEALNCPPGTADFINAAMVLRLESNQTAATLLGTLQAIETNFGRQRSAQQNQARTLDLDLISYENQQFSSKLLTLPHSRATQRKFVLLPIAEIMPSLILPGQSKTVLQLLDQLQGEAGVKPISTD